MLLKCVTTTLLIYIYIYIYIYSWFAFLLVGGGVKSTRNRKLENFWDKETITLPFHVMDHIRPWIPKNLKDLSSLQTIFELRRL